MIAAKYIHSSMSPEARGLISQPRSEGQLGWKWDGTTSVSTVILFSSRYAISSMRKMAANILKSLKIRRSCRTGREGGREGEARERGREREGEGGRERQGKRGRERHVLMRDENMYIHIQCRTAGK